MKEWTVEYSNGAGDYAFLFVRADIVTRLNDLEFMADTVMVSLPNGYYLYGVEPR